TVGPLHRLENSLGPESLLEKLDHLRRAANSKIRRNRVIAIGDGLYRHCRLLDCGLNYMRLAPRSSTQRAGVLFLSHAAIDQRHLVDIDDSFPVIPTLPSRRIEMSFCASTAIPEVRSRFNRRSVIAANCIESDNNTCSTLLL